MYYKIYYPQIFWYTKIKYARNDNEKMEFNNEAAKGGEVIFLPHVNYSKPHVSIRKVDGDYVLQQGLMDIKGIGEKAAFAIHEEREKNGVFVSFDDFFDRCAGRIVNKRVVNLLSELSALEFNKKLYIKKSHCIQYSLIFQSKALKIDC